MRGTLARSKEKKPIRNWMPASAGTVMLSGLPVLAGIQFLIGFFSFDLASVPRIPLIRLLGTERKAEVFAPRQVAAK